MNKSKNFLFIGYAIPDCVMQEIELDDKFPAIQTHKFIWNFIKAIEYQGGINNTYISTRPVSEYPFYPLRIIRHHESNVKILNKIINIIEIPFINLGLLKIITRFSSVIFYGFLKFHTRKSKDGVIVYSVHVPFMLAGYIFSKIYNIELICLWTDPPAVPNKFDSRLKSFFRKLEFKLAKFLMRKADKVIVLTKYLAIDFAPNKPYLVIEGIIDNVDINQEMKRNKNSDKIRVVYTGSIAKRYGIKNIVDGFRLLKNKNVILEIYGSGDFSEELVEICKSEDNILYKGFLNRREILDIQRGADFLINARSSNEEYVKYSFPSKTLEYMCSGTPLITTMLPGIPLEYEEYILKLDNNEPEVIMLKLEELTFMDSKERIELGERAKKFAESKNYKYQGRKISEFLLSDFKRLKK
ncbi:glycosyltransferase [Metasolibacillus fluoroglycofenilyticus]|uniref:glycosyltransferase n=1 Tax=Metasolibacillus fluoroglycofenilyticus TaxID=1239396 RepID=UPI000D35650C|nr:glycosyltransferase [Metasolibacillus fluoroglycofenilyticus]